MFNILMIRAAIVAASNLPMSIIIVGGISVSAIMTFYVVPAAFYLFEGRRRRPELEVQSPPPYPAAGEWQPGD